MTVGPRPASATETKPTTTIAAATGNALIVDLVLLTLISTALELGPRLVGRPPLTVKSYPQTLWMRPLTWQRSASSRASHRLADRPDSTNSRLMEAAPLPSQPPVPVSSRGSSLRGSRPHLNTLDSRDVCICTARNVLHVRV